MRNIIAKVAGVTTSVSSALIMSIPLVHAQDAGAGSTTCQSTKVSWLPDFLGTQTSDQFIQNILNILLFVVVIAAVIYITLAGIKYITSQGDAGKTKESQAAITNAVIGLVVSFGAYFLVSIVLGRFITGGVGAVKPC